MHTHKTRGPKEKIKETCKWKLGTIKERNSKSTFRKVKKIKREIRIIKERNSKINIRKVKKGKMEIAYMHMKEIHWIGINMNSKLK